MTHASKDPMSATEPTERTHRTTPATAAADVARGAAIGVVEIIPGVSGGTVALVLGIYERLISSAGHLVRGAVSLVGRGGRREARAAFAAVDWRLLVPLAVGMLAAIVLGAAILGPLVESHPIHTRAVFAGLVLASLVVPIRMVGRDWSGGPVVALLVGTVVALLLTSLPTSTASSPPWYAIVPAAAVAVCALVLPGLSGSYLLLVMGMYAPTLAAVNERDLGYLGLFVLGAVMGLASFVSVLRWLLEHHRALTLATMTGLMVGSLRALWPWQTESGGLLGPDDTLVVALVLFLAAVALVLTVLALEGRRLRRD